MIKESMNSSEEVALQLRNWLEAQDSHIPKKWKKIGREVYGRKTLLVAAAETLRDSGWKLKNPWKLAATDVFVEKAQRRLTMRALLFVISGGFSAVIALACAATALTFAFNTDMKEFFGELKPDGFTATLVALKAAAMAAFTGGIILFFTSIAKALFHEGTALYRTRHALRFGRLYVYLRDGEVSLSELENAFAWNREFTTAFRDMKISSMSTPFDKFADAIKEAIRREKKNGKSEKSEDKGNN